MATSGRHCSARALNRFRAYTASPPEPDLLQSSFRSTNLARRKLGRGYQHFLS